MVFHVFSSFRMRKHTPETRATAATAIVLFFAISLLFLPSVGNVAAVAPQPPEPTYVSHTPISITSDYSLQSQASSNGWLGTGTQSDPYVIRGYDIDGGNNACISIYGTTLYVRITGNYLHNATNEAVYIKTTNITLDNNTIADGAVGINALTDYATSGLLKIENNTFTNLTGVENGYNYGALSLFNSDGGVVVQHNTINAFASYDGFYAEHVYNASILHNTVSGDCSYFSYSFLNSDNNTVAYNIAEDNTGYAGHGFSFDNSDNNNISYNTANNNRYGFWTFQATGNEFYKCWANDSEQFGFYLEQSSGSYINNSEAQRAGTLTLGAGISLEGSNNIAYHNWIRDVYGYGIKSMGANTIRYNVVESCSYYDYYATAGNNTVMFNAFIDPTTWIYANANDTVLHNFWGNSTRIDNNGDGYSDIPVDYHYGNDTAPLMRTWHPPITISSASDYTPHNGVVKGNGTENNPYIIEGLNIDGGGKQNGIYLKGAVFVKVQNCTVSDSIYALYYTDGGSTTTRYMIINNIFQTSERGIYHGFGAVPATIRDNIIRYNQNALYIGWKGATIYHNHIYGNNVDVASLAPGSVLDAGYPTGGNWWDRYDGVDYYHGANQNLLGPDLIGDTPYIITTGVIDDHYPMIENNGGQSLTYDFDVDIDGRTVICYAKTNIYGNIRWDFGDTMGDSGAVVVHEYDQNGTYNITMTISTPERIYSITKEVQIGTMPVHESKYLIIPLSSINPAWSNMVLTQRTVTISIGISALILAVGMTTPFITPTRRLILMAVMAAILVWLMI